MLPPDKNLPPADRDDLKAASPGTPPVIVDRPPTPSSRRPASRAARRSTRWGWLLGLLAGACLTVNGFYGLRMWNHAGWFVEEEAIRALDPDLHKVVVKRRKLSLWQCETVEEGERIVSVHYAKNGENWPEGNYPHLTLEEGERWRPALLSSSLGGRPRRTEDGDWELSYEPDPPPSREEIDMLARTCAYLEQITYGDEVLYSAHD